MSQFSHPTHSIRSQAQAHRAAWLAALLTLLAAAAVVLIVAISDSPTASDAALSPQPAVRTDGGPDESGVAASVASRQGAGSSESAVAAAVGGSGPARVTGGPDESNVAASLSTTPQPRHVGPDEAATASAISGR